MADVIRYMPNDERDRCLKRLGVLRKRIARYIPDKAERVRIIKEKNNIEALLCSDDELRAAVR